MMKKSIIRYLRLALLLLCFEHVHGEVPTAKNGVLDLRGQNMSTSTCLLSGQWAFYWDQLLTPADLPLAHPCYVSFPSLWKDDIVNGARLPSKGCATYSLTLLLPEKRPSLAMEMPDTYCAYRLFVNGALVAENGVPGKTAEQSTPFWATGVVALPPGADTMHILLQVSNFWHAKGGTYKDMLLGNRDDLVLKNQRNIAYGFVLAGCLFMGGLFFLGLYLFGRQNKPILYFSLFCMLYSYRMVGTDTYVLHTLFPSLSWFITIRLEYLSIALSVAFFALYTYHLYAEDCRLFLIKSLVAICFTFAALSAFAPPIIFTSVLPVFLGSLFIYIAYACHVYVRAALHRRIGSMYALTSSIVMLLIFLLTNLNYFSIAPPMRPILFVAYIFFFFLQSLALSQRFAHSFRVAAFQAQQGLNAKAEFLSTMSHEIRTPLNAVIGMAHLLKVNQPRKDQQENLNVLYFSASNLLSIVNNILDYTKIEEGKIIFESIPLDLAEIAGNIIAGLKAAAEEKNIGLKLVVDARLNNKMIGDPTRTSQVINNLVHNAIKFTQRGGVELSILAEAFSESSVSVTIRVEDTGIGISQDKQLIIFDRFTQADSSTSRSYGGTGLGLAITKRILELQGVQLRLQSEPGKGSVFYFTQTFPLSSENMPTEQVWKEAPKNNEMLHGLSILLVEDNPLNVLVAQTILEGQGANIDVATNGQEALDKFDTHKHKLILMDLHMPVLDGYRATEELRRKGATVPIIALTASAPKEVESEAYASGLNDIVVKPFNPDDLYRTILHYVKAG